MKKQSGKRVIKAYCIGKPWSITGSGQLPFIFYKSKKKAEKIMRIMPVVNSISNGEVLECTITLKEKECK